MTCDLCRKWTRGKRLGDCCEEKNQTSKTLPYGEKHYYNILTSGGDTCDEFVRKGSRKHE